MGAYMPKEQADRQVSKKEQPSVLDRLKQPATAGITAKYKQNKYVEVR